MMRVEHPFRPDCFARYRDEVNALSALRAVQAITDPDSFRRWDGTFAAFDPLTQAYSGQLEAAFVASGSDESVLTGDARIGGVRTAVLAWEFGFLGGSVGVGTAARVVSAVRRATEQGLPLVAMPRSGGTRMQEGAPAFVQMVAIAAALAEHRAAGLPYLVHLCGPTTGGVLATLGSAGDITSAEPGAMVGFLGPRAYTAITGEMFPEGIQTAENLLSRGLIDAIVPWDELRERWATILGLWADRVVDTPAADPGHPPTPKVPGGPESAAQLWDYVEDSRHAERIDSAQFLAAT